MGVVHELPERVFRLAGAHRRAASLSLNAVERRRLSIALKIDLAEPRFRQFEIGI